MNKRDNKSTLDNNTKVNSSVLSWKRDTTRAAGRPTTEKRKAEKPAGPGKEFW